MRKRMRSSSYLKDDDISFDIKDAPGPYAILRGKADPSTIELAASIVAYHTKLRDKDSVRVDHWKGRSKEIITINITPAKAEIAEHLRI